MHNAIVLKQQVNKNVQVSHFLLLEQGSSKLDPEESCHGNFSSSVIRFFGIKSWITQACPDCSQGC